MYDDVSHHFGTNNEEEATQPVFHPGEHAYADAEFQEAHTILADGGDHFGVSAIAFDLHEELLWMGNQGVNIFFFFNFNI